MDFIVCNMATKSSKKFVTNKMNIIIFMRSIRVRISGKIRKWVIDPRSLGLQCMKGTERILSQSVPLMHCDPIDHGLMIHFQFSKKNKNPS